MGATGLFHINEVIYTPLAYSLQTSKQTQITAGGCGAAVCVQWMAADMQILRQVTAANMQILRRVTGGTLLSIKSLVVQITH